MAEAATAPKALLNLRSAAPLPVILSEAKDLKMRRPWLRSHVRAPELFCGTAPSGTLTITKPAVGMIRVKGSWDEAWRK